MTSFLITIIGIYCLYRLLPALVWIIGAPIALIIRAANRPMTPEEIEAMERKQQKWEEARRRRWSLGNVLKSFAIVAALMFVLPLVLGGLAELFS